MTGRAEMTREDGMESDVDHHLFQIRLQTGALTIWELGDLLGIHPPPAAHHAARIP
ncbi:hypothetical protein [Nonomuraea dietziae]|uniref:hypothetical protein n=1 Tax=Nonomuraea dietziae TaxID=65515 RepID=UPI0031D883A6